MNQVTDWDSLGTKHQLPSAANGRSNEVRVELPVPIFSGRTNNMPSIIMELSLFCLSKFQEVLESSFLIIRVHNYLKLLKNIPFCALVFAPLFNSNCIRKVLLKLEMSMQDS